MQAIDIPGQQRLKLLSQLISQTPTSMMLTDLEGNIEYVNPAFTESLGYSLDEVRGLNPRLLKSGDTPAKTYEQLWATITRGEVWRGEMINRSRSGDKVHESLVIVPIKDEDGKIEHYVALKQDISVLRGSERALHQTNRMLRLRSECSRALIRSNGEQQQLQRVCDVLVRHGGYSLALVASAESSQAQQVRWLCYAGDASRHLNEIDAIGTGEQLSAQVIRSASSQLLCVWQPEFDALSGVVDGVESALALPLIRPDQQLYSVLWLFSTQPDGFSASERGLLEELAEDIGFGLSAERTRLALNESEAKFRVMAEAAMVGVYMIQAGRFVYTNPYMADVFGYTIDQLLQDKTVMDLVAPESRQHVLDNLQRRVEGQVQSLRYEFTGLRANGERFRVEVFGSRTFFEGEPCVVGTLIDISDRLSMEKQLRLLRRAIEAANNGIAISDLKQPENPFVYVNPAFEQITGYSSDEVVGRNGRFLLGRDRGQPELAKLVSALRQHQSAEVVLKNYRKDGSLFWNDLSMAPVRDESGEVGHYVSVINDMTQSKLYQQQLERLSSYDELTGLANTSLLRDRLEQSLIHARRNDCHSALVMLDLDRFKMLYQSAGLTATDRVLCTIGERIASGVRDGDTVARLGADDFAVVLHDLSSLAVIGPLLQQLMARVSEPLDVTGEGEVTVTCSIGVAVYPQDGADADTLLRNAEAAQYKAMEQHNSFRFYTPELNERAEGRLQLEMALNQALERDEFELYYQPKVDLVSGRVCGAEALIRWNHPDRGVVPPNDFIAVAEETGMIIPIGAWALKRACIDAESIRRRFDLALPVAVNLSAKQLNDVRLEATVREALTRSGLAPELLECELTESMLVDDPDSALATIELLKRQGVRVALDDFGTGYSSLAYLKRFPIDTLKIDRSFIKDIPEDRHDTAISKAIIAMAEALGLYVVAEGVETSEQRAFLEGSGCDAMQGYLFSRPLPLSEFEALLATRR